MDTKKQPTKQQRRAARLREAGWISFTRWIRPEHKPAVLALLASLELKEKQCPKANDCRNACTGSNEPGQHGSAYPAVLTASEHPCCGALASGPHKMGCDHKLMQAAAPTDDEHWCDLCGDSLTTLKHDEAIGYYRDCAHCGSAYQGKEERAMSQKPCRCGPDGCADSVACPRGGR